MAVIEQTVVAGVREKLAALPQSESAELNDVDLCSQRGDLRFFLRDYAGAVADYRRMVELDASLDASHWRLGIALFMAGHPEEAAGQFDRYHSFDDVDRENGIWRYLSHCRAFGQERAAKELLRYQKDDRPPFGEVYRMFDGTMSVDQVQQAISPDLPPSAQAPRRFYTDLYVGMYHLVRDQPEPARLALQRAVLNPWGRTAGYGPRYMWQVARVQLQELNEDAAEQPQSPGQE
ncbi:MAG: hypothetical protein KDA85_14030 [Planctomycetaceae bacterium]|nr:hypothetical protein [Planctomycetaceae bacterium]